MFSEIFAEIWKNFRGRTICSLFGAFTGFMVLWLGLLQTLFLLFCIGFGFFLGNKIDKNEDLMEWLDRLLPAGYHR